MDRNEIIKHEDIKELQCSPPSLSPLNVESGFNSILEEKDGKMVADSSTMMTKLICPNHTDTRGYVYGGQVLSWIDIVASIAARTHAKNSCVTRSVDAVHFLHPIHTGDILVLKANVNRSWKTSIEVGVRVEAESPFTGIRTFCCHAYLTFVAIKAEEGANIPIKVPNIVPASESEIRRFKTAENRRQRRLQLSKEVNPSLPLRQKLLNTRAFDPLSEYPIFEKGESREMFSTYGEIVELVLPQHANTVQITFGGQIMEWMEYCASVCALRLARTYLLTASVDTLQFIRPTYVGNVVTVRGVVTAAYKSSMEVYVIVSAEDKKTGKIEFTNDAFFTLVSVDEQNHPIPAGTIIAKDKAEMLANTESLERRKDRLKERRLIQAQSVQSFRCLAPKPVDVKDN